MLGFQFNQVLLEGDGQNNSVAVRMALGETQLVAEAKQFLTDNGIHLEVFNEVISWLCFSSFHFEMN